MNIHQKGESWGGNLRERGALREAGEVGGEWKRGLDALEMKLCVSCLQ